MTKLLLLAHESVCFSRNLTGKEIRNLVKNETKLSVRRLDNFTLISLNAVYRLLLKHPTSQTLALYSGAEYLSVELFQSVIKAMHEQKAIRPFDFIATVGNAANFYLAKEFNIKGPNIFIGATKNIFLKNILLAESDLNLGHSQQAIVVVWLITEDEWLCHAFLIEQVDIENLAIKGKLFQPKNLESVCIDDLLQNSLDIVFPVLLNTHFA